MFTMRNKHKKEIAPAIVGGLIAAGGSLLGALSGSSSAKSINKSQIALSREQMQFQERMSSTAYQRSAKDLEAAGLNRILALGSPASSPGGAQPPSLKVPGEYMQRGISSAAQSASVAAGIHLTMAQAAKAQNEADILKPRAVISGEAGNMLDQIVTTVKKRGPALAQTAKQIATQKAHKRVKLTSSIRDRIAKDAAELGKQIPGDSPNLRNFEPSRQQEKSYRESNTPRQNLDAWIILYAQTHNSKPGSKAQAAYLKYLKGNQ